MTTKHFMPEEKPNAANLVVPTDGRSAKEVENIQTVLTMFDAGWGANPGWKDVWRDTLSTDVCTFFHSHPVMTGIDTAIEFNEDLFSGFPELAIEIREIIADGDTVVVRGHLKGTHDGLFLGIPASGAGVDVPDVTIFRLKEGKIVESRYFTDLLDVMTTIGAVSPVH